MSQTNVNDFLLIIDGSSLLSTQYYGNLPREVLYAKTEEEKAQYYHKLMQTSKGVYTNGVFGFLKTLLAIVQQQKPAYLAICWDRTRDTFRREIYQEYKGNRKSTPEPLKNQFKLCQDVLEQIGVCQFSSDEFEADDYAGTLATKFKGSISVSIMTKDRDYLQLVDEDVAMWMVTSSAQKAEELYKKHGVKKTDFIVPDNMFYLTPELVVKEFGFPPEKTVLYKALAGDTADNIPGVKGIGDKTAVVLANAYDNVEALYDELREATDAEVDAVKERWKTELGLKRSPMKYLLAKSEEGELLGEEGALISQRLATIKRDIPLDDVDLAALATKIRVAELEHVFHELEFQSLSIDRIDPVFLDGDAPSKQSNVEIVEVALSEVGKLMKELSKQEKVAVSVLFEKASKDEPKNEQLDLFSFMNGDFGGMNTAVSSCIQDNKADDLDQVDADNTKATVKYDIYAVAMCSENDKGYLIKALDVKKDLQELVRQVYEMDNCTVSFDVKTQLPLINNESRASLVLIDTEQMPAFDVSVAAYLMNPLKAKYTPYDIALDYDHGIVDRQELIGKSMLKDLTRDRLEDLYDCIAKEAVSALACAKKLEIQLKDSDMWKLFYEIEMPTLYTLYEMEYNGVIVKREALKQYGDKLKGSIDSLEQKIYDRVGHEFNINSPKQLGIILFEELGLPASKKTKSGYSTSAEVLEGLKTMEPVVADVLEYRQLTKLHSTYAEGLAQFIDADGRIHGHFNQTVTATGRISSTEPNLQNIPMRTELGRAIRKVFVPKENSVFVDADYSQIELRILAHLSGDERLQNAFREGQDIHALTASQVFDVPFDEVTSLQRRNAKAVNFGIVYGISAHGLSVDLGITRKEAADYIESYFAAYPSIKTYLDGLVNEGREHASVRTMFGRIRPIPELHSTNFNQRNFGERVAMNSPIQGTAADIMKLAMVNTYRGLVKNHLHSKLVLQIHDELVIETVKEELEQVKEILAEAMRTAAQMDVELLIDMNVGDNWYDAK